MCQTALPYSYAAALEVSGGIPGGATSTVRAYASLLPDESDDLSPPLSAEETEFLQVGDDTHPFRVLKLSRVSEQEVRCDVTCLSCTRLSSPGVFVVGYRMFLHPPILHEISRHRHDAS